jgi:hypothetical protein
MKFGCEDLCVDSIQYSGLTWGLRSKSLHSDSAPQLLTMFSVLRGSLAEATQATVCLILLLAIDKSNLALRSTNVFLRAMIRARSMKNSKAVLAQELTVRIQVLLQHAEYTCMCPLLMNLRRAGSTSNASDEASV